MKTLPDSTTARAALETIFIIRGVFLAAFGLNDAITPDLAPSRAQLAVLSAASVPQPLRWSSNRSEHRDQS
jgi:hypothetical protein